MAVPNFKAHFFGGINLDFNSNIGQTSAMLPCEQWPFISPRRKGKAKMKGLYSQGTAMFARLKIIICKLNYLGLSN